MGDPAAMGPAKLDIRSLWRNASWTSAALAVTTALAFAETVLLVRFLGATVFGLFILIRAYPEAVQQILDCRTRETIIRYLGEFVALEQRERAGALVRLVWVVDAVSGLAAMAVVFATVSLAARYVAHDTTVASVMAIYAVAQFAETLDSGSGPVLRVFDRFRTASIMGVSKCVARFTAILVVLLLGGGIATLVYALVGVEVLYLLASTGISISVLRRTIGFRIWGSARAIQDRRREILRFLLQTNLAGTLKMGSEKLIVIIVGVLGGAAVTAYYKVAVQVGSAVMLFSDPLYVVVYPSLSRLAALRKWGDMYSGLKRLHRLAVVVAVPAGIVASGLMFVLLPAVFGEEFSAAVVPAIIILWGVLPDAVYFWLVPLLACLDQVGRLVVYRAMAAGLQFILALTLIPFTGAVGAAISLLAMHWIYVALRIRLNRSCRLRLLEEGHAP